jgi:hypothetical protein
MKIIMRKMKEKKIKLVLFSKLVSKYILNGLGAKMYVKIFQLKKMLFIFDFKY